MLTPGKVVALLSCEKYEQFLFYERIRTLIRTICQHHNQVLQSENLPWHRRENIKKGLVVLVFSQLTLFSTAGGTNAFAHLLAELPTKGLDYRPAHGL